MNLKLDNINIDKMKTMNSKELEALAVDIRELLLDVISTNGGHLASNLGMVEATIALHRVFNSPDDKIIFDVGHQCYVHKILTGRASSFDTLRTYKGISGFNNRKESSHDILNEGHCGTSLSSALGIAEANYLQGNDHYTIAIVGDGALTNGMIYEALNNCSKKPLNLIMLLNDNDMSISKNVGGLHKYLNNVRSSKPYFTFKHGIESILNVIPLIGKPLAKLCKKCKNRFKKMLVRNTIFEDMGLYYLGPVDGNDIDKMTTILQQAKKCHTPCVVHMSTTKGKGYSFAENTPENYHSVAPFDLNKGVQLGNEANFSSVAGDIVCDMAEADSKVCAITAAMTDGTGLTKFARQYSDRFFDVGIAEEHAVTFASGLAVNGMKPILFLYSTFTQRAFDQIFHDIAVQELPLILAIDRAGIVSGDGITHQGIFDYSLFASVPNVAIYSPSNYDDMRVAFNLASKNRHLSIIRYPKGSMIVNSEKNNALVKIAETNSYCTANCGKAEIVILTYGRIAEQCFGALQLLKDKYSVGMVELMQIAPINYEEILTLTDSARLIYVVEEGVKHGGLGEQIGAYYSRYNIGKRVVVNGIEGFVEHGGLNELFEECEFTAEQIAKSIENWY